MVDYTTAWEIIRKAVKADELDKVVAIDLLDCTGFHAGNFGRKFFTENVKEFRNKRYSIPDAIRAAKMATALTYFHSDLCGWCGSDEHVSGTCQA